MSQKIIPHCPICGYVLDEKTKSSFQGEASWYCWVCKALVKHIEFDDEEIEDIENRLNGVE